MKITVAISGASGSALGVNFVKKIPKEIEVFVVFSKSAKTANFEIWDQCRSS